MDEDKQLAEKIKVLDEEELAIGLKQARRTLLFSQMKHFVAGLILGAFLLEVIVYG